MTANVHIHAIKVNEATGPARKMLEYGPFKILQFKQLQTLHTYVTKYIIDC